MCVNIFVLVDVYIYTPGTEKKKYNCLHSLIYSETFTYFACRQTMEAITPRQKICRLWDV